MLNLTRKRGRLWLCIGILPFAFDICALRQTPQPQGRGSARSADTKRMPSELKRYVEKHLVDPEIEWDGMQGSWFLWDEFDLNGDGKQEYFILSYCSPTGNCELDVLEKRGHQYLNILDTDLANVVCTRRPRASGYRDLEIRSHASAFESPTRVFRFKGKTYEVAEEFNMRWEYDDKTGKSTQVEGPTTSDCHELFLRYANKPAKLN